MKQLFLCERTYPLYRTLVRALLSPGDDIDILMSERTPGLTQMAAPLRESGLFRHVYVYQDPYYADFQRREEAPYEYVRSPWEKLTRVLPMLAMKLLAYARYQRRSKKLALPEGLDLSAYDEIYVDELPSAAHFYLLHTKVPLICVEHGNNCFQFYNPYPHTRLLIALDKLRLLYATRGCSRRYLAVEVSENKNLLSELRMANKDIRERSMDGMVAALDPAQKNRVFDLYCQGFGVRLDADFTYDIVLTTPVYYRSMFIEAFQQGVFRHILTHCTQGADRVLLKPHPLDNARYTDLPDHCLLVPALFPGEVLAMGENLRIRRVITIDSSSVRTYQRARERVELGIGYLEHFDAQGTYHDDTKGDPHETM